MSIKVSLTIRVVFVDSVLCMIILLKKNASYMDTSKKFLQGRKYLYSVYKFSYLQNIF